MREQAIVSSHFFYIYVLYRQETTSDTGTSENNKHLAANMKYSVVFALIATLLIPSVAKGQEGENEKYWSLGERHQRIYLGLSTLSPQGPCIHSFAPLLVTSGMPVIEPTGLVAPYLLYKLNSQIIEDNSCHIVPGIYLGLKFYKKLVNSEHPLYFQSGCDIHVNHYAGKFNASFLNVALPGNLVKDFRVARRCYFELAAGLTLRANLEGNYCGTQFRRTKQDSFGIGWNASFGFVLKKGTISYQMNSDFNKYGPLNNNGASEKIGLYYNTISFGFPLK